MASGRNTRATLVDENGDVISASNPLDIVVPTTIDITTASPIDAKLVDENGNDITAANPLEVVVPTTIDVTTSSPIDAKLVDDEGNDINASNPLDVHESRGRFQLIDTSEDLIDENNPLTVKLIDDSSSPVGPDNPIDVTSQPWDNQIRLGRIPGHAVFSVLGHNSAFSTTRLTISPGESSVDVDQSVIHASASTVKVSSSSTDDLNTEGTGAWSILLSGLSAAGAEQSETIVLNGQTAVTSSLSYAAINGMKTLTAGSGRKNVGIIYAGSGSVTSGVPAKRMFAMEAVMNVGMTSYYTVPAGKTALLKQIAATTLIIYNAGEISIDVSTDGLLWVSASMFGIQSGMTLVATIGGIAAINAGDHIRITGIGAGASTNIMSVLDIELVDD